MLRPHRCALLLVLVASLGLTACNAAARIFWSESMCGPAFMSTTGIGYVTDSTGARIAMTYVRLGRREDDAGTLQVDVSTEWERHGAPLRGHVTRARLVGPSGEVLLELPTTPALAMGDVMVASAVRPMANVAAYDAVRAALEGGGTTLIIDTDLPGLEHVVVTQQLGEDRPMGEFYCG